MEAHSGHVIIVICCENKSQSVDFPEISYGRVHTSPHYDLMNARFGKNKVYHWEILWFFCSSSPEFRLPGDSMYSHERLKVKAVAPPSGRAAGLTRCAEWRSRCDVGRFQT